MAKRRRAREVGEEREQMFFKHRRRGEMGARRGAGVLGEITYICCVLKISWWERRGAHGVGVGRDGAEGSCVGFGGGQKTKWRLCSRVMNTLVCCVWILMDPHVWVRGERSGWELRVWEVEERDQCVQEFGHWEVQRRARVGDAGVRFRFLDSLK